MYLSAAFVFYGWPALLTFGFSDNLALLLLVLNCRECRVFESNNIFFFSFFLVAQRLGRRTFDQVVLYSIPGRGASSHLGQLSLPSLWGR